MRKMTISIVLLAVLTFSMFAYSNSQKQSAPLKLAPVSNTPISQTSGNQGITVNQMSYTLVNDSDQPEEVKAMVAANKQAGSTHVVKIDDTQYLFIGLGERPTGGYSIKILHVEDVEGKISVVYQEIKPGKDAMVTTALTYPYVVIKIDSPLPINVSKTS